MRLKDLNVTTGESFHFMYDRNHVCKDDTPIYYLIDNYNWLTICQDTDNDDGLWRGEWVLDDALEYDDYVGRKTPQEVLDALQEQAQLHEPYNPFKS